MLMKALLAGLVFSGVGLAQVNGPVFVLDNSKLTYHMSHPVHEMEGVSRAAKGKGNCNKVWCDFLVAAPVKSFDSGDSNRDLHMLQVTRGAQFPLVTVRFRLPQSEINSAKIFCDLDVEFAGEKAHYAHVEFEQKVDGKEHRIKGTVPSTVKDFKIDPPSFLMVAIKNEIPVRVEMMWREQ